MPDNEVLLIEDCAPERNLCVALLSRAGFTVSAVADAQSALDQIKELGDQAPPVIVVDWELPKMNGMQLVMLLRGMEFRLRPYIMMLTSRAQTGSVVAALNRGADDYVIKPIVESELVSRLRVADRTVTIQRKLVERAEKLERQIERLSRDRHTETPGEPASAPVHSVRTPDFSFEQVVRDAAVHVLGKLHLSVAGVQTVESPNPEGLVAWTGLAVPELSRWLDICLVAPGPVAETMVSRVVREDVISDVGDWLAELANLVRSHVRRDLNTHELASVPSAAPRSYLSWPVPLMDDAGRVTAQQYELSLDCGKIHLAIGVSETRPRRIGVEQLEPGLFVSESLQAAQHPSLTLAKVGTVVTRQMIETLRSAEVKNDLSVLEVSPFAQNAMAVA